jgi:hypothetical protein
MCYFLCTDGSLGPPLYPLYIRQPPYRTILACLVHATLLPYYPPVGGDCVGVGLWDVRWVWCLGRCGRGWGQCWVCRGVSARLPADVLSVQVSVPGCATACLVASFLGEFPRRVSMVQEFLDEVVVSRWLLVSGSS